MLNIEFIDVILPGIFAIFSRLTQFLNKFVPSNKVLLKFFISYKLSLVKFELLLDVSNVISSLTTTVYLAFELYIWFKPELVPSPQVKTLPDSNINCSFTSSILNCK